MDLMSTAPASAHPVAPPTSGITVAGTQPYAWPWTGSLDPSRVALVIAGADPWWIKRSHHPAEVLTAIDEVAGALRQAGGVVVHVQHAVSDRVTASADAAAPRVDATDITVRAAGIDGFFGSSLDTALRARGLDTLVLAGFGLEAPVHSTLRSANDQGYECLLLTDACAPLDPRYRDAALSTVTMSGGIFGAIGSSPSLIEALTRAVTPHPVQEDQP